MNRAGANSRQRTQVLAALGTTLGILFRMRAPLLFGSAFLGVAVFAQIWHAAVDRQQACVMVGLRHRIRPHHPCAVRVL